MLSRLKKEINKLKLNRDDPFGFRDGHSTTHQIIRLTEYISRNFNWKHNTGAVLLYVEKAFDSVWVNGLLKKLIESGISKPLMLLIGSYLSDRSFEVLLDNNHCSGEFPIKANIPQVSLSGPILFNLYSHDMPGQNKPNFKIGFYEINSQHTKRNTQQNPCLVRPMENQNKHC